MKIITVIAAIFFTLTTFSQENPWENKSSENPWNTGESKKENNIEVSDSTISKIQDTTYIIQKTSISIEPDSLSQINYQRKGFKEMDAHKTFTAGAITCSILNIYGAPIPTIVSCIPNSAIKNIDKQLQKENPLITESQISDYKRGMKNKRILANIGGCITGVVINSVLIVSAVILSYGL